jgi:hypothetical protein
MERRRNSVSNKEGNYPDAVVVVLRPVPAHCVLAQFEVGNNRRNQARHECAVFIPHEFLICVVKRNARVGKSVDRPRTRDRMRRGGDPPVRDRGWIAMQHQEFPVLVIWNTGHAGGNQLFLVGRLSGVVILSTARHFAP